MNNLTVTCDFCASAPAVARHKVDPRSEGEIALADLKDWYACADCHTDVLAENEHSLLKRMIERRPDVQRLSVQLASAIAVGYVYGFKSVDAGEYEMLASQ